MLPFIKIFNFHLDMYPIFFGIAVGYLLIAIKQKSLINTFKEWLWIFSIVVVSFIGARVIFLLTSTSELEFKLGGGLVIMGAIITGLVYLKISADIFKIDKQKFTSSISSLALAHAIGRIGCFLAGCCFGIEFGKGYFPVQLLEAAFLLLIYFKLNTYQDKKFIFVKDRYLLLYSISRFALEFLRDDQVRGIYWGVSTSQWLCVFIFLYLGIKKIMLKSQMAQ